MIKIETISKEAVVKVDGKEVKEGYLFTEDLLETLEIENGEVMYSVHEKYLDYKNSKDNIEEVLDKACGELAEKLAAIDDAEDAKTSGKELDEIDEILKETNTKKVAPKVAPKKATTAKK